MKLASMHDLLLAELRDLYSAENQIIKALPKIARKASAQEFKDAVEQHLEQTRHQVARLDEIFEHLEEKPRGKKCQAMEGLLEEGKELMQVDADDVVRDAALIAACQRVEHYEIAGYGAARTFAQHLGLEDVVRLLDETLQEEKDADQKLTDVAETAINAEATQR